jgi:uncharacterized Zn finger protein
VSVLKSCPCPQCKSLGVWHQSLSEDAYVDYYRCFSCAFVWSVPKDTAEPVSTVSVSERTSDEGAFGLTAPKV